MKNAYVNNKIAETLTAAGVSAENAPAVINHIFDILATNTVDLSERIPTDIAVARFVSDFDDGSSFGSTCLVDTGKRRILALSSAGCPCDDAACQEQYVILPNGETRRVNDPDQDIVYPYGYNLCWNEGSSA